jgi:hypothetical protein
MSSTHEILTALARPFPADAVSWRVGQAPKAAQAGQGDSAVAEGRALAYIDARDAEDRLDEVMGVHWQSRHEIHLVTDKAEQSVLCVCHISLLLETPHGIMWISRSNGSGETDYEGQKGALSKAFVRAASAWGVGRFLYAIGSPKVKIQQFGRSWMIARSEEPRLRAIVDRCLKQFETNPRMRPLTDDAPEGASVAPSGPTPPGLPPAAPPSAPGADPPRALLRALRAIQDSTTGEEALVALAEARRDRAVDPVAAEEIFSRWLCLKAAAARTEETLTRIEGALNRASLGAKLTRETRETIAQARKARPQ